MATVFGSIGAFIKRSMAAGATTASALDYSARSLETQAFLMNLRGQASALNDVNMVNILKNYLVSEDDSENIAKLVAAAKLQQQQTPNAISATTLTRH